MKVRTSYPINQRSINTDCNDKYCDHPPIRHHIWDSIDQTFEEGKKAKLNGAYRPPAESKTHGGEFMIVVGSLNKTGRTIDGNDLEPGGLSLVHVINENEQNCYGNYHTKSTENDQEIIDCHLLLQMDPNVKSSSQTDQTETEQRQSRWLRPLVWTDYQKQCSWYSQEKWILGCVPHCDRTAYEHTDML